jgi:hypothetical protein
MKEKSKCSIFCEKERIGQSPCQLECMLEREQKNKNKMSKEPNNSQPEKEELNFNLYVGYSAKENKMLVLGSSGLRFKNLPTMQEIVDAINEKDSLEDVIILSISYFTKEQYLSLFPDVLFE